MCWQVSKSYVSVYSSGGMVLWGQESVGTCSVQDFCSPTQIEKYELHKCRTCLHSQEASKPHWRTQRWATPSSLFVLNNQFDHRERLPFRSSPGLSRPFAKTVMCSRLGFIFTRDTDVSALVQDFIKAQPVVYCGERLPRLIFLQCIPFCSFLAPKKTPRWASYAGAIYQNYTTESPVHLFRWDGASDCTVCQLCLGTRAGGCLLRRARTHPLMSLSSCRGCHNYSVW